MGTYTSWVDGELILTVDNTFSWFRHKAVSVYVFTQDEYDYDDVSLHTTNQGCL